MLWRRVVPIVTGLPLTGGGQAVSQITKIQNIVGERFRRALLGWLDLTFTMTITPPPATPVTASDMGRLISEINAKVKGWGGEPAYLVTLKQLSHSLRQHYKKLLFPEPATIAGGAPPTTREWRTRLPFAGVAGTRYFDSAIDPMAFEDLTLSVDASTLPAGSVLGAVTVSIRAVIFEWHKGHIPVQFQLRGKNLTSPDRIEVKPSTWLLQLYMEQNADAFVTTQSLRLTDGRGRLAVETIRYDDLTAEANAQLYDAASEYPTTPTIPIVPILYSQRARTGAGDEEVAQLQKAYGNKGGTVVELSDALATTRYVAWQAWKATRGNVRGRNYIQEGLNRDPDSFRESDLIRKPMRAGAQSPVEQISG